MSALLAIVIGAGASVFGQTETVLHTFQAGNDGYYPEITSMVLDRAGNLYGTTTYGGGGPCSVGSYAGCGMIYQLRRPTQADAAWTENVIWRFQSGADGGYPGGLVVADGKLFGVAGTGGTGTCSGGCGYLFRLTPPTAGQQYPGPYNVLGRITTDGIITGYPTLELVGPSDAITTGPDGALWFAWTSGTQTAIERAVIAPNPARANRAQQTAPIKLGTSGSNIKDIGAKCCGGGTLGALVTKGGAAKYILSNNHVLALLNTGVKQDSIIQRGYIDTVPVCSATGTVTVAALYDWVKLDFTGGNNLVDAAIAQTNPGMVDPKGTIIGIGTISSVTTAPAIEMLVEKAGRTTGKTTGSINALNVTARIGYQPCGGGAKQTVAVPTLGNRGLKDGVASGVVQRCAELQFPPWGTGD